MTEGSTWHSIWEILSHALFPGIPAAKHEWLAAAKKRPAVFSLLDDLRRVEEPHREEIEWAIETFCNTGEWPVLSENSRFFLRLRVDAAAHFVFLHFRPRSHESIVPLPQQTTGETIRWLLTDWWDWHGRKQICVSLVVKFEEDEP